MTHRGAFRVCRLQFGVNVALGIFQNLTDSLLEGIPKVTAFFDNVLMAAHIEEELTAHLHSVFQCFHLADLKVKWEKCLLGVDHVDFLGFTIDVEGIHPVQDKIKAICDALVPTSMVELQAFLGLLNFYHTFVPHKAEVTEPFHWLLDKKAPWFEAIDQWVPSGTSKTC